MLELHVLLSSLRLELILAAERLGELLRPACDEHLRTAHVHEKTRKRKEEQTDRKPVLGPKALDRPVAQEVVGPDLELLHQVIGRAEGRRHGPEHAVRGGRHRKKKLHDAAKLLGRERGHGRNRPVRIERGRAAACKVRIVVGLDHAHEQLRLPQACKVLEKAGAHDARIGLPADHLVDHGRLCGLRRIPEHVDVGEEAHGIVAAMKQLAHGGLKARKVVNRRGGELLVLQVLPGLEILAVASHEDDRALAALGIRMPAAHRREHGTSPVTAKHGSNARLGEHDVDLAVLHRLLHVGDRVVAEGDAVGSVLLQPGGRLRDERHARIGTRHFSGGKAKWSGRGGSAEDQAGDECACCGSKAGGDGRNAVHGTYFLGSVRSSHERPRVHKRETAHGKSRMPH